MVPLEMMYLTQIIDDSLHSGLKYTTIYTENFLGKLSDQKWRALV